MPNRPLDLMKDYSHITELWAPGKEIGVISIEIQGEQVVGLVSSAGKDEKLDNLRLS